MYSNFFIYIFLFKIENKNIIHLNVKQNVYNCNN